MVRRRTGAGLVLVIFHTALFSVACSESGSESVNDDVGSAPTCSDPLVFADPALESALREALDLPTGPIAWSDARGVTSLDLFRSDIQSLDGLECLIDLEVLYLRSNEIADLLPLAQLENLTNLNIEVNEVTDFAPLVENAAIGAGDFVFAVNNPLDCEEQEPLIDELLARCVNLFTDCASSTEFCVPPAVGDSIYPCEKRVEATLTFYDDGCWSGFVLCDDQNPTTLEYGDTTTRLCDGLVASCDEPGVLEATYTFAYEGGSCQFCSNFENDDVCVPLERECGRETVSIVASGSEDDCCHPMNCCPGDTDCI